MFLCCTLQSYVCHGNIVFLLWLLYPQFYFGLNVSYSSGHNFFSIPYHTSTIVGVFFDSTNVLHVNLSFDQTHSYCLQLALDYILTSEYLSTARKRMA